MNPKYLFVFNIFIFLISVTNALDVKLPDNTTISVPHVLQNVGKQANFNGFLYIPSDKTGCNNHQLSEDDNEIGYIFFIQQGNCDISKVIQNAQSQQVNGIIISNSESSIELNVTNTFKSIVTIPVVTIDILSYDLIIDLISQQPNIARSQSTSIYAVIEDDDNSIAQNGTDYTYMPFFVLGVTVLCTILFLLIMYLSMHYGIQYWRNKYTRYSFHLDSLTYDGEPLSFHQDTCTICLESFVEKAKLKRLPCDHLFHHHCIEEWFQQNHFRCPVCKKSLIQSPNSDRDEIEAENDMV